MKKIKNSLMVKEPSEVKGSACNRHDVPLKFRQVDPKAPTDSKSDGTEGEKKRKRDSDKIKASSIDMSEFIVGDWRRRATRATELTAKVYYARKTLNWEIILDENVKVKMEIRWSDITAIRAVMPENQPGILHIELGKPPSFYEENPPVPGKHTTWHSIYDFTGGQALLHRRHYATFPSEFLNKHYKTLICCNERLFNLSRKPFPGAECPYFCIDTSSNVLEQRINFNGPMTQQYPVPQFNSNGPRAQQYQSQVNQNGPMTQQVNFNGPMTQQVNFNVAAAGNQSVPTPNGNRGAGNCQLMRQAVQDAEMMLLSRANRSLCNAQWMLLPGANPSPQQPLPPPRNNYQEVFPGRSYQFDNLVPPNNIGNLEMLQQEPPIAAPNTDVEITRFAQAQQVGPSFFTDPDDSIDHRCQMSGDVDRAVMLRDIGPSVRPDTLLPSPFLVETDFNSENEDLEWILRKSREILSKK